MTNKRQTTMNMATTMAGTGRDETMNSWVEMRMTEVRARGRELAEDARATRLARLATPDRVDSQPTLRVRLEAAVAAWKQPGRLAA